MPRKINTTFLLKIAGQFLAIFLLMPAIIYWALFAYSGHDLQGLVSLLGFIIDGYRDADEEARDTFLNGLFYGSLILTLFLGFLSVLVSYANDGGDSA